MHRRQFIKAAVAAGTIVTIGAAVHFSLSEDELSDLYDLNPRLRFIQPRDLAALVAIFPVMVGQQNAIQWKNAGGQLSEFFVDFDRTVQALAGRTQQNLRRLLDVLSNRFSRWASTGITTGWSNATPQAISHFLTRWKNSAIGALNEGYLGLHELFMSTFYAHPHSWELVGYPGPPSLGQ